MPRAFLGIVATLLALGPSVARADECVDAYDGSQRARRAGRLLDARAQLLSCAQTQCPEAVSKQCTLWLREVTAAMPSVVFAVRDADGNDQSRVRVTEGERVLTERLDGRALELDPGEHLFHFELPSGVQVEKRVLLREGEKNRQVQVELLHRAPPPRAHSARKPPSAPRKRAAPPERESGIPTSAIVLGAVGVLALGSFTYFAIDANSDLDELERRCKPDCPESDENRVARKALVADVSLGVGVVALGAAGWLVLARPEPARASAIPRGLVLGFGARL